VFQKKVSKDGGNMFPLPPVRLLGPTMQKTVINIFAAMETSSLTLINVVNAAAAVFFHVT
jgi:hypothetical protein